MLMVMFVQHLLKLKLTKILRKVKGRVWAFGLQEQRYEGASTIYGPHTLEAYIQVYSNLSKAMATVSTVSSDRT